MDKDTSPDKLYATPQNKIVDFCFDERVAEVFPDMIRRSVPGYDTLISLIGLIAQQYAQPNSFCYDLGCSLGAVTLSMHKHIQEKTCQLLAIDNSLPMIIRCRTHFKTISEGSPVHFICADIQNISIKQASVVVMNFTLQFIHAEDRLALLKRIHAGMLTNSVLILSEKIVTNNQYEQDNHERIHRAFKKANQYSNLEISQKRSALEKVLKPNTVEEHIENLKSAGFVRSHIWYQCFNFVSFLAFV